MRTRNPDFDRAANVTRGLVDANAAANRINAVDQDGNEAAGHTLAFDGAVVTDLDDGIIAVTIGGGSAGGSGLIGAAGDIATTSASGAALTLDLGAASVFDITLTANCTLTFTPPDDSDLTFWIFIFRQDSTGSRTVTWPSAVQWQDSDGTSGGSAPTLFTAASAIDVLYVTSLDGGATYGGASVRGDHRLLLNVTSGDPHTQYVLEASTDWVDLTDGNETTLHTHAGLPAEVVMVTNSIPPDPVLNSAADDWVYSS